MDIRFLAPDAVLVDGGCFGCGTGFDLFGALWSGSLDTNYITQWLTGRTAPNIQYTLVRIFDCFSPGDGVRTSTYSLQGSDASSVTITEHQLKIVQIRYVW